MKVLLIGTVVGVLTTGVALAADMPLKAPGSAPFFNWTGCYLGGNAGLGVKDASLESVLGGNFLTDVNAATYKALYPGRVENNAAGFTGGGQVGCNFQSSNWLFGVEADINHLGLKASAFVNQSTTVFPGATKTFTQENTWFGTVRARVGMVYGQNVFYVTGGAAYGESKSSIIYRGYDQYGWSGANTDTRWGWTVGGGGEFAVGGSNWSVKMEYLYVDLRDRDFPLINGPTNPIAGFTISAHETDRFHVARLGLNYRFWPY